MGKVKEVLYQEGKTFDERAARLIAIKKQSRILKEEGLAIVDSFTLDELDRLEAFLEPRK